MAQKSGSFEQTFGLDGLRSNIISPGSSTVDKMAAIDSSSSDHEDLFFEKDNQQMPKDWLNNTACEDTCSEDDRDKNKEDDEARQDANMDSDNKDHNKDTGMLDDIHEADEEYSSQLSES